MATITMPTTPARTRIAPSPTGDPHVGTAYIALFNKALAVRSKGQFLLRIEDTDRERYVEGSEKMIFEALRWLSLDYDEGPDVGGPHAPYRQSERSAIYKKAVDDLLSRKQAYRCFCTAARLEQMRSDMKARKEQPGYDRTCRKLSEDDARAKLAEGVACVVRLAVPLEGQTAFEDGLRGKTVFENRTIDDQVLLKSDGLPKYHLANVVDDHEMRITHVIRAEEWITSTPKHVLLYRAFGWEAPAFCHMPLLRNKDKSKISKRKNPTSLIWYRDEGFLPEALVNFLGLMGYSMSDQREIFTKEEFIADFDISRVGTTGPVFDLQKLEHVNGEWIQKRISLDDFVRRISAHWKGKYDEALVRKLAPLIQPRIKKLKEWSDYADSFFFGCPDYKTEELSGKRTPAEAAAILDRTIALVAGAPSFEHKALEEAAKAAAAEANMKPRDFLAAVFVAVTGKPVAPPLFDSMEILGRDETLARLRKARAKLA
ncbi:glutamate--tRNA ligase [bacterium]|nr:glutamate--tRNA ligase [bacterium]